MAYHERTKHHYDRSAASLGYLDWATQPDPFRRYEGAPLVRLPLPPEGRDLPYWRLYMKGGVSSAPLTKETLSLFFRYALSLTAWKSMPGATWSLRANPSSGNLHPTEGYALLPALEGLHGNPGLYHYAPKEHGLERRAEFDPSVWEKLSAPVPPGSFLAGLSSVYWREAWKYGERAFRYCQHDTGHALGTLRLAAAALGWKLSLLEGLSGPAVSRLLGLDRDADYGEAEREDPELLALVTPGEFSPASRLPEEALRELSARGWAGKANILSPHHAADWDVIDEAANASTLSGKVLEEDMTGFPTEAEVFQKPVRSGSFTAEKIILGRRSAVSMDGSTALPVTDFFRMMGRLMPTQEGHPPWDAIPWRPRLHLGLFLHRVTGLSPGLYALVRDPAKVETLRKAMAPDFLWQNPQGCPPGLPLYLLKEGDYRGQAAGVSCGQNIAGDGAFSLGMIADFKESLVSHGAAFYRNLFWESGLVGQVLYLEAEEAGLRATGIGCYFDNPVHQLFGLTSKDFQGLYHFTVGGPIEDKRLSTLPAYEF